MKDLHTTPNEHLEARITAWVLGQASPFEAAELEALCAADPELQLFHNRTKALHALLLETPPSTADQFWKLSPENRAKLDPIIGPNSSTPSHKHSSIRRAAYRTAFGIAAVLTATLFIKRFIILSPPSVKESFTIVTYESTPEKASFSGQVADESFYNDTDLTAKSKDIRSSSPRKPSSPSFSAPVQAMERDSTLAMADRQLEKGLSDRDRGESNKPPGMAPSSKMAAQEFDAMDAETQTSAMSNAIAASKPSANSGKGKENDGGIGYGGGAGGGGGQSDMSNTFLAVEALSKDKAIASNTAPSPVIPIPNVDHTTPSMDFGDGKDFGKGWGSAEGAVSDGIASNDSKNKGGFIYEPGEGKKESLKSYGSLSYDGKLAEAFKGGEDDRRLESSEINPVAGSRSSSDTAFKRESLDDALKTPQRTAPSEMTLVPASEGVPATEDLAFSDPDLIRTNPSLVKSKNGKAGNEDPFAGTGGKDDPFAAAADPFTTTTYSGITNVAAGTLKADLSSLLEADVAGNQKNNSAPADGVGYLNLIEDERNFNMALRAGSERRDISIGREFQYPTEYETPVPGNVNPAASDPSIELTKEGKDQLAQTDLEGFINYGSPIVNQPKQIDITTKFVEGAQENTKATGFGGITHPSAKADLGFATPADPAKPIEFETLKTEFTGEVELPLLGDIPMNGRLFQESEIQAGYKSEYLFRGLSLTENQKPSLIDLSNELSTKEEVFSTFSLNISDASFQLARAAIEKGERPDPTSIKPEQFYNAIDYGDPAPSASEPVAAAIDQTAHPVIPSRNLVRVALRTASTGRSAAQPLRLTLLVDQSGSMVRADRRVAMEKALAQLATLLTEHDRITVIGFSRTPHLLAQSLPGNEAGKLSDIINQTASEGGTNLEQAINLATEQALDHQLAGAQNRIVLFTDGAANLGDADPDRLSKKIQDLRQQGLAFDIAGIGTNDVNDRLLSDLARHGNGRYYLVGEKTGGNLAAQLAGAFRPAAENVKVQVKLNPQRVGNYKLIGFEKDRLKTEDFRNDTVDAAELAADEAGVALYQVETLPEGSGEIGEVSVRFRETTSGEMVERTWTIPYDASAPSFDKANPKTQLATLALLAAQKLQTGPLADAIDFSNYSKTIAQLKQANANSSKTQQLLNLINSIK